MKNNYKDKAEIYDRKNDFSRTLGCKNVAEGIDACGGRLLFEKKFKEYNG